MFFATSHVFFRALEEHEKMSGKSGLSKHKKIRRICLRITRRAHPADIDC